MGQKFTMAKEPIPKLGTSRAGGQTAIRVGLGPSRGSDIYHRLISRSWFWLITAICSAFLGITFSFALVFYFLPGSVNNVDPNSFADAFNFSMQTLSTLGYGNFSPESTISHVLVTVEVLLSLLLTAISTGLFYGKFSRPTAKLLFSEFALIGLHDGYRSLTFRIANRRGNRIIDADIKVTYARNRVSKDGSYRRDLIDLSLRRSVAPVLSYTWSVFHDITEASPLSGADPQSIREEDGALMISVNGRDEDLATNIHAQHIYSEDSLVWGGRFVDILSIDDRGRTKVNYDLFHKYERGEI
jgi:inward rectifier potassium channel